MEWRTQHIKSQPYLPHDNILEANQYPRCRPCHTPILSAPIHIMPIAPSTRRECIQPHFKLLCIYKMPLLTLTFAKRPFIKQPYYSHPLCIFLPINNIPNRLSSQNLYTELGMSGQGNYIISCDLCAIPASWNPSFIREPIITYY